MRTTCFLLLLFTATTNALAGAWTQKKDAYYAKFSYSSFSSQEEFDTAGARTHLNYLYPTLEQSEFSDKSFSFYGEYGFGNYLTGITSVAFKNYTSSFYDRTFRRSTTITESGLSDLYMGLRYQVLLSPFAAAVQGLVKLPLARENNTIPLSTTFADAEIRASVGGSTPLGINNYAQIEAGYTFRGGDEFEDTGLYFAEFGIYPVESLILKATIDGVWSIGTPTTMSDMPLTTTSTSARGEQRFTRLSGGVIYRASREVDLSVEITSFVAGRNAIAGETLSVGIAFKTP